MREQQCPVCKNEIPEPLPSCCNQCGWVLSKGYHIDGETEEHFMKRLEEAKEKWREQHSLPDPEELKDQEEVWDIGIKMARVNYKEKMEELDDLIKKSEEYIEKYMGSSRRRGFLRGFLNDITSKMEKIMGSSRRRGFLNNMKSIEEKRKELKDSLDKKEKEFIEFKREMEEMKKRAREYQELKKLL
ncbi:MAG: hypothetical protein DDT32_00381 [Syntrophomonadaceae bacterium]|nr:hypothetical protein [Bacillota bacterium]